MGTEELRRIYVDGVGAWPGVGLSFEAFAADCAVIFGSESEVPCQDGSALFLARACASGDEVALRTFERETQAVARAAIANVRRDPEFVQETLQQLWDKLFCGPTAKVAKYTGRGPLTAWVRAVATRVALDRCREFRLAADRQSDVEDWLDAPKPGAESMLLRARYGDAFQRALEESVSALPLRERNALRMHVCGHCSIDEIGRAYGVHRATAARWVQRAMTELRQGIQEALGRRDVKLTDSEFLSVARDVRSQLEVRLTERSPTPPSRSME